MRIVQDVQPASLNRHAIAVRYRAERSCIRIDGHLTGINKPTDWDKTLNYMRFHFSDFRRRSRQHLCCGNRMRIVAKIVREFASGDRTFKWRQQLQLQNMIRQLQRGRRFADRSVSGKRLLHDCSKQADSFA